MNGHAPLTSPLGLLCLEHQVRSMVVPDMSDKKLGRRAAGSWGRPGSSRQKRAASKASRRNGKRQGRNER